MPTPSPLYGCHSGPHSAGRWPSASSARSSQKGEEKACQEWFKGLSPTEGFVPTPSLRTPSPALIRAITVHLGFFCF